MSKAPEARPATHVWCTPCNGVRPIDSTEASPSAAAQGFDGDHISCAECGTIIATVYVKRDEADAG